MENITLNLVAVVVLLVINGFFVTAEFALVKAKGFCIETLAKIELNLVTPLLS